MNGSREAARDCPQAVLVDLRAVRERRRARLEDICDRRRGERAGNIACVVPTGSVGEDEKAELGSKQDVVLVVQALTDVGRACGDRSERAGRHHRVVATVASGPQVHGLKYRRVSPATPGRYRSSATCSPKMRSMPESSAAPTST